MSGTDIKIDSRAEHVKISLAAAPLPSFTFAQPFASSCR
jgi:hypothetical protein